MKLVKKFVLAVILVSALSVPTLAGDMETPGKTPPPPPPGSPVTATTTTEETTGIASADTDASFQLLYDAYMAMLGVY